MGICTHVLYALYCTSSTSTECTSRAGVCLQHRPQAAHAGLTLKKCSEQLLARHAGNLPTTAYPPSRPSTIHRESTIGASGLFSVLMYAFLARFPLSPLPPCHRPSQPQGLGKTLQGITLMWTLLQQGAAALGGVPIARRALIVCPTSLVSNWASECDKWLQGRCRCGCLLGCADLTMHPHQQVLSIMQEAAG